MRALAVALAIGLAASSHASALAVDRIGATVRRPTSDVRACYVRALALRPELEGRIVVRFTVEATGVVGDVSAESDSVGDPSMQLCVLDAVRRWQFPPASESETVSYPFELRR